MIRENARIRTISSLLFHALPLLQLLFPSVEASDQQEATVALNLGTHEAFSFQKDVIAMGQSVLLRDRPLKGHIRGRTTPQLDFRSDANSWFHFSHGDLLFLLRNTLLIPILYSSSRGCALEHGVCRHRR